MFLLKTIKILIESLENRSQSQQRATNRFTKDERKEERKGRTKFSNRALLSPIVGEMLMTAFAFRIR